MVSGRLVMVSGRLVMVSGGLVMSSASRCTTSADLREPYRGEKATPGGLALCRSGHGRPAERGATLDTAWWPRAVGSHRQVAPCCGVTPPGGPVLWGQTAWWPRAVGSHRQVALCCGVTPPGGPMLWGHPAWWPRAMGSPPYNVRPDGGHTADHGPRSRLGRQRAAADWSSACSHGAELPSLQC